MQINSKQIEKLIKETERLNKPSIKLVDSPKRDVRKVDNLYAMQNFAMEEMLKALEINKNN
jgi:hypothetical protein